MTSIRPLFDWRWVAGFGLLVTAFFGAVPPIAQIESYHRFADERYLFGIPNFWNVISNVPFVVIGIAGLLKRRDVCSRVLFAGVLLTGLGSSWYHSAPGDARLIWDRLPMTVIFMAFLACVFEERRALLPLLLFGAGSVIWWHYTNDLRPYAVAKFGPIVLLLPGMMSPAQWPGKLRVSVCWIVGLIAVAQLCEMEDRCIYAALALSGHTVKHLIAGAATYMMFQWRGTQPGHKV